MNWIQHYQLFLFDFDGILVDTEELHYQSYLKMCANRGFSLQWDRSTYLSYALHSATGVKEGIYRQLPDLQSQEPHWEVLYGEKRRVYYHLLQAQGPNLVLGVKDLLEALDAAQIKRCVVTHSPREQIDFIRSQHPILNSIPNWITREDYSRPKPASECYQKAIDELKQDSDRIIGFEDSPRGLQALLGTEAEGVLISDIFRGDELEKIAKRVVKPFDHYHSFPELFKKRDS